MYANAKSVFSAALAEIESAGLWKHERLITSPQAAHITTNGKEVINFCANNYLGLSSHPRVMAAARKAPGSLNYASGGIGSAAHLSGAAFASATSANLVHVPYKGSVEIVPALIRGDATLGFPIASTAIPQIENGIPQ